MTPDEALDLALTEAKKGGAEQADAIFSQSQEEDIEVYQSEVTKAEACSSQGVGIRLISNGSPGYAYSQRLSSQHIKLMVKDALANAQLSDNIHLTMPEHSLPENVDLHLYDDSLSKYGLCELKEFSLEAESVARDLDPRVINIPHAGATKSERQSLFRNHNGQEFKKKSGVFSAYIGAVSQLHEQKKSGNYGDGSRKWSKLNPRDIARIAVERCTELLGAKPVKSGQYPVVFSNRVTPSLLGMYLSNFNLEQIQKGQSKWTEQQLGKKIATDQLSLQCRPHIPEAPGSRLMDSEGVICRDLDLIENGTLIHFINNLESAAKAGLSPTGHGSRGIRSKAGASFSNLFVPKGTSSLSDLLHSHSRCLYITKLEGGAACSAISGELSIGVQGFWVEDGAIVHPVDSITLNGNFFDLLNQIEGISNAYQDSFSSYHIPDLLVTGLSTSG